MRIPRLVSMLAALALLAAPAWAQDIPADQSCGGLLCDMGVLGHKVAPPPAPPAPVVVPAAPPVAAAPAAGPPPRRRPRVARQAVKPVVASPAAPVRVAPVAIAAPPPPAAESPPSPPPESQRVGPSFIFQSIDPRFQLPE